MSRPLASFAYPAMDPGACKCARGSRTPHSQLRQFNFGVFDVLSLMSFPQALSEQFADPTYAQPPVPEAASGLDGSLGRTKSTYGGVGSISRTRQIGEMTDLVMH